MKTSFFKLLAIITALLMPYLTKAQCQFVSPTVELISTQADVNGNCVVTFNLGFEIDVNNGNKIVFIHLWKTQDYTSFNYSTQNQPTEANILANALATIIIDNDAVDNNPAAPASQVFLTTYGPDPGIDDNTGPAKGQVKDASDGLTYTRVVVNAATNVYRYTINNLSVIVPGACSSQIGFTGDAWSSNANSSNPAVQCSMTGFTFLTNDPLVSSTFACSPVGTSNTYSYAVTTATNQSISFNTDVYVDNGDNFFDVSLDVPVVSNAGPFTITSGTPYNSGNLTYPAPYSTTAPYRTRNLWVVVKNITITNNALTPPVVTSISNLLLERVFNTCSAVALPISVINFTGSRKAEKVNLKWSTAETANLDRFVVQRKTGTGDWKEIAVITDNKPDNGNEKDFDFTEENRFAETSLYRIKAISTNGEEGYTKQVMINGLESALSGIISPNPSANGALSLNLFAVHGSATIKVFNMQGQVVASQVANTNGTYTFNNLSSGTYFVNLTSDAGAVTYLGKAIILGK